MSQTMRPSRSDDYARMAEAIRYLAAHREARPTLAATAAHVGLSPWHFQRRFTRWAGVSPKRFLQFLTLEHAKGLLAGPERRSVLDATYAAGLSGPARLHDLFVSIEAMTPGEYRAGGAGLVIRWGVHPSPFGPCLVATTPRGVCALRFLEEDGGAAPPDGAAALAAEWPGAELVHDPRATEPVVRRLFALGAHPGGADGEREAAAPPLALHLRGTNLQLRTWAALLRIPCGEVATYEQVAAAIGAPRAVRAVGTAIGRNPVAVLIPCHRVLRKTGALGGYRWGLERKRALLAWEGARAAGEGETEAA